MNWSHTVSSAMQNSCCRNSLQRKPALRTSLSFLAHAASDKTTTANFSLRCARTRNSTRSDVFFLVCSRGCRQRANCSHWKMKIVTLTRHKLFLHESECAVIAWFQLDQCCPRKPSDPWRSFRPDVVRCRLHFLNGCIFSTNQQEVINVNNANTCSCIFCDVPWTSIQTTTSTSAFWGSNHGVLSLAGNIVLHDVLVWVLRFQQLVFQVACLMARKILLALTFFSESNVARSRPSACSSTHHHALPSRRFVDIVVLVSLFSNCPASLCEKFVTLTSSTFVCVRWLAKNYGPCRSTKNSFSRPCSRKRFVILVLGTSLVAWTLCAHVFSVLKNASPLFGRARSLKELGWTRSTSANFEFGQFWLLNIKNKKERKKEEKEDKNGKRKYEGWAINVVRVCVKASPTMLHMKVCWKSKSGGLRFRVQGFRELGFGVWSLGDKKRKKNKKKMKSNMSRKRMEKKNENKRRRRKKIKSRKKQKKRRIVHTIYLFDFGQLTEVELAQVE